MKLPSFRPVLKCLIGSALIFAMSSFPARSQGHRAAGSFVLPFEVQWGTMTLQPGAYSFTVDDAVHAHEVTLIQGTRNLGMVFQSFFYDNGRDNAHGSLVCVRHNSTYSVRALRLPNLGTVYYSSPKSTNQIVAQEPELIQSVPVTASGL